VGAVLRHHGDTASVEASATSDGAPEAARPPQGVTHGTGVQGSPPHPGGLLGGTGAPLAGFKSRPCLLCRCPVRAHPGKRPCALNRAPQGWARALLARTRTL